MPPEQPSVGVEEVRSLHDMGEAAVRVQELGQSTHWTWCRRVHGGTYDLPAAFTLLYAMYRLCGIRDTETHVKIVVSNF